MNNFLQKHFTTGQFAAMYGINKRTLMYYDSIGLFKPAVMKENGYRYYTFSQTTLFDTILLLRKLRVPLEAIKTHLTHYTPQKLLEFLHKQNQMIEQEIDELLWLQRAVQNKIGSMEEVNLTIDPDKIEILELNAQAIVISESISDMPIEKSMKVLTNFLYNCYHTHNYSGYPIGYMMNVKKLQKKGFNETSRSQITHYFSHIDEKNFQSMNYACKPSGRYLVGYYKGPWTEMDSTLQTFADYANNHGLTFTGHAYIEGLMIDTTVVVEAPYYWEAKISILLQNTF